MPWEHCGIAFTDDADCSACGLSKEAWTLQFEVTRTFVVKRRPVLRITLLDEEDGGIAGEPYRVTCPNGERREGELDEVGFAKIPMVEPGLCVVEFPNRAPYTLHWDGEQPDGEDGGDETDQTPTCPDQEHPHARFEVKTQKRRYVFRETDDTFRVVFHHDSDRLPGTFRTSSTGTPATK